MFSILFFKRLIPFLLIPGIVLGITGPALALRFTTPVIGMRAGWTNPEMDDHGSLSNAPIIGIAGGVRTGDLEFELGADWFKTTHRIEVLPFFFSGKADTLKTKLEMLRLMVTGKYHFKGYNQNMDFFLGAGGGGYRTWARNTEGPAGLVVIDGKIASSVRFELENVYGGQFLAGLDYRLSPGIRAGLEYRILVLRSELFLKSNNFNATFPARIIQQEFSLSVKYVFR